MQVGTSFCADGCNWIVMECYPAIVRLPAGLCCTEPEWVDAYDFGCHLAVLLALLAGMAGGEQEDVQVGSCCLGWALTTLHQPPPKP